MEWLAGRNLYIRRLTQFKFPRDDAASPHYSTIPITDDRWPDGLIDVTRAPEKLMKPITADHFLSNEVFIIIVMGQGNWVFLVIISLFLG